MSKKKTRTTNDYHFRYKNERIKEFLDNQTHKSQSIELAILLAINTFGQDDLITSIEKWILDKKINVYSDKNIFASKEPITTTVKKDSKKEKVEEQTKKKVRPKADKSTSNLVDKKEKPKIKNDRTDRVKRKRPEAKKASSERLSNEEINKVLWDGNSSNL